MKERYNAMMNTDYTYLVQLRANGIDAIQVVAIANLRDLVELKHDSLEVFYLQCGKDPQRLRWGYDGVTLYLYDRYGCVFDRYAKC
jgi:hypothetical protein